MRRKERKIKARERGRKRWGKERGGEGRSRVEGGKEKWMAGASADLGMHVSMCPYATD